MSRGGREIKKGRQQTETGRGGERMGGKNEAIVDGKRPRRTEQNRRRRDPLFPSFSMESINAAGKEGTGLKSRYLTSLSSFQRKSLSPENANDRNRSPEAKKLKKEEDDDKVEKGEADQDLVVDDNDNNAAAVAPPNGNRSPRENGGSNGDASAKKEGSTGAVSPSSARSTPASGASGGGGKKEEKAGEGGAAVPAKMSPPAARALAGLGKS